MNIALGSDHRGRSLKRALIDGIRKWGGECQDFGSNEEGAVDYPDIARSVAESVAQGRFTFGVLVCGTGLGMSMAANKVRGVRAAVCQETFTASRARMHNDANLLCLGQDVVGPGLALEILRTFLDTPFEGGRHAARIEKIKALESRERT